MPSMVVNVDTWGSGPNALVQGDVVPSDCPGDIAWATANKVIVSADEYQTEHPEWRPPGAKEEAPAAETATAATSTRRASSSS